MFWHNFKYASLTLLKDKMLIFWTFAFPIILGTFFYMAFSNIENSEKLSIIDIAIVDNEDFNSNIFYKETFKVLSDSENEEQLFNTCYVSLEEANNLLNNNKISGYLVLEKQNPKVVVKENGINETILKYTVESINQTASIFSIISNELINKNGNNNLANPDFDVSLWYSKIYSEVLSLVNENNVNIKDISNSNLSYTMIEYYTLIAMTCLYGGILGLTSVNKCLANMSNNGKRVAVSPIPKSKLIISSVLSSYLIELIGLALLFLYTIFILKVDYGSHIFLVILLALIGAFAGLSLGIAISSLFKTSEETKIGITIAVTMLGCFFSGMMGITMKYIIDKNIPIINKLNPASMITDGFYSLYYYNTLDRYYFNIISLLLFAGLMIFISIFSLRRQKYDSI